MDTKVSAENRTFKKQDNDRINRYNKQQNTNNYAILLSFKSQIVESVHTKLI